MKAIVCEKFGHPSTLVFKDVESRQPGEKEVLVEIKACGVNFPDTLIVQGLYQFKPPMPFTPGSDIAGVVKAVGEGVKNHKVGDEVFGLVSHGGFAEEVIVPANSCFPKPPALDYDVAASFMMAYGTSYYALKDRAKLKGLVHRKANRHPMMERLCEAKGPTHHDGKVLRAHISD